MTPVSIVVVSWNTRELLLRCLASVGREAARCPAIPLEVVVVDNGSTDGSADAVESAFPEAQVLRLARNLGFAAGCNRGLEASTGRLVLLLNSDAELMEGAVEHCVGHLDAHPDVAAVGPQLLHPDGSRQNSVHNFPMLATEIVPKRVFQWLLPRRFPSWRSAKGAPIDVEALVGAAVFLRREVLDQVGGLPEEYFFFMEETDWCWRVREAGWRIVYLPGAFVMHVSGASSKRVDPTATRIEYHRSLYRFFRRHRGRLHLAMVLVVRFVKSLFYVVTQAPLALQAGRRRVRWAMHRDVFVWHLRGCPASAGLGRGQEVGR